MEEEEDTTIEQNEQPNRRIGSWVGRREESECCKFPWKERGIALEVYREETGARRSEATCPSNRKEENE